LIGNESYCHCDKCKRVIDRNNGTEIKFNNRFYHVDCFTCVICNGNLNNSINSKYKVHDNGEAICSVCELAQAKICYVCREPILSQESIIFDEKNYHKNCFYCAQCHKSLIDEKDLRKHNLKACCIQCYNEQFAPRCEQCFEVISTGKSTVYNGKKYHPDCFRCNQCNKVIMNSEFSINNSKFYCLECYNEHFLPKCLQCFKPILNGKLISYNDKTYHQDCFRCEHCNKIIIDMEFSTQNSKRYCIQCYNEYFAPKCAQCFKSISVGKSIIYNEKTYHSDCFRCGQCNKVITDSKFHIENSNPCCTKCYNDYFAPHCEQCFKSISIGRSIIFDKKTYHPDCFRCNQCDKIIIDSKFQVENSKPCCIQCYNEYFKPRCSKCLRPIIDKYRTFKGKNFHIDCFQCMKCHRIINNGENFYNDQHDILCSTCAI
ncbi:unnamed protein product, partial [Rotaria sp. Silwood2]